MMKMEYFVLKEEMKGYEYGLSEGENRSGSSAVPSTRVVRSRSIGMASMNSLARQAVLCWC
jgi:hypothetical protein